jgi:hypothetical protein
MKCDKKCNKNNCDKIAWSGNLLCNVHLLEAYLNNPENFINLNHINIKTKFKEKIK